MSAQPPQTTAQLSPTAEGAWNARARGTEPLELRFPEGRVVMLDGSAEWFVLPSDPTHTDLTGSDRCWVLPTGADDQAWLIETDGVLTARVEAAGWTVIASAEARITAHARRPHADLDGGRFAFDIPGGGALADALAGFYWDTMVPSIVERTTAADYADSSGYVVSTLADKYQGTYPDVDHEFQIKGRLAAGSAVDRDVVRRMIELQLRMMREDPAQLWRDPCAVQPDGDREYHVRRNSADGTENAVMFLVTGNIEVLESIWLYVAGTRDLGWLRDNIDDIEGAASGIELHIDGHGRLWGDVYYEDQVIKDGRETMAQALAIRSFELLAELERLIGRDQTAARYRALAAQMSASLAEPLPHGWWDPDAQRYVDWVDRSGRVHDHIHLLANILPVLVGAATDDQRDAVERLVQRELPEFQRFPTFLSARIADYTDAEIGDGGPYDLCAAGRYWCWDAAFWSSRGDGRMLDDQLQRVAAEGATDDYVMGERYDMHHVYYTDGPNWHGAAHYYEYPCVFTWVLMAEYLGVRASLDADLLVAPRLAEHGTVLLEQQAYQLRYTSAPGSFTLENLADTARSFRLDVSSLAPGARVVDGATDGIVRLAAGESITLAVEGAA
ncbi:hypothetical protein [Homoserinibacter sp. GY 40078]|uniref:hypothetical protein n=1 Tax=Homoserinibacter sp. GY 40078 TaxID=2603275 RepID=UPI0011C9A0E8|nr:hypothetical protein [Homoserinibacter sp. GY 40078]TXK18560.1 hypothetical protein FVQ89_00975 [Homoserinibacter sp. GY 40078]